MVYSAKSAAVGTISQFTRRKDIKITTGGTSTPANYQVKVTIAYEPGMQATFADIRFNTKAGVYIDYWIESKVDSDTADVWLELPDAITDPGSDTVWMYYGNDAVSDGGNISDTFIRGDDFDDELLADIWTFNAHGNSANTYSETTNPGKMTLTTASSDMYQTKYNFCGLELTTIPTEDFEMIVEVNSPASANYEAFGLAGSTSGTSFFRVSKGFHSDFGSDAVLWAKYVGAVSEKGVTHSNDFVYLKLRRVGTIWSAYWTDDLSSWTAIGTTMDFSPDSVGLFGLKTTAGAMSSTYDNFRIRKYIANEPTSSVGTAQHQRRIPYIFK